MLVSGAIKEARRHLGGDPCALKRVTVAATTSDETLTLHSVTGISPGTVLEPRDGDGEQMHVWTVDSGASTVDVLRGHNDTTPQALSVGDVLYAAPRFPLEQLRGAVTDELRALSGQGLYRQASTSLTWDTELYGYDLSSLDDFISPYRLEVDRGAVKHYLYDFIWRGDLIRDPLLRHNDPVTLLYRATLQDVSGDDDDLTDLGVPESAHDIVPLGAALRLITGKEALRVDMQSQTVNRRAEEVPVGSHMRVAGMLQQLHGERMATEVHRLRREWPLRQARPSTGVSWRWA